MVWDPDVLDSQLEHRIKIRKKTLAWTVSAASVSGMSVGVIIVEVK